MVYRNSVLFNTVYLEEYIQLKKKSKAVEQGSHTCALNAFTYVYDTTFTYKHTEDTEA